ncbi:hypothetical protein U0070_025400 [Myodes glareolus]|uniref:Uncharacterized protein n=1 Tax=Myodes glareolus TaxID=447135 RepID=A0AAW0IYE4_MYOGA
MRYVVSRKIRLQEALIEKGPGEVRCSLQLLTSCVVQQGLAGTADSPTTEVPGLARLGSASCWLEWDGSDLKALSTRFSPTVK